MYGVSLKREAELKRAEYALRRFRLEHDGVDKSRSVVFRFTKPFKAMQCLTALELAGVKARIVFQI